MCLDFLPEIRNTAVDDFNCRLIEDLVEDVVCREFFVKDFEKCSSNVGGYVSAEWGIIPNDVAEPFFLKYDGRADCNEKESVGLYLEK